MNLRTGSRERKIKKGGSVHETHGRSMTTGDPVQKGVTLRRGYSGGGRKKCQAARFKRPAKKLWGKKTEVRSWETIFEVFSKKRKTSSPRKDCPDLGRKADYWGEVMQERRRRPAIPKRRRSKTFSWP